MRALPLLLSLSALVLLAACGGGGGGAPPPPAAALSGTLTVPNLGAGSGGAVFDGDAFHARDVGALGATHPLCATDRIGPPHFDALDVFRLRSGPGRLALRLEVGADAVAALHVVEARSGRQALRIAAGEVAFVDLDDTVEVDLVVEAIRGEACYTLNARVSTSPGVADARLPLPEAAPGLRTSGWARYLGAHHEMVPGEVVVVLDAPPLDSGPFDATRAGLVPVRPAQGADDLGLYRLATATSGTIAAGAPLEHSLEADTCLAAKRVAALPGVRAASPNFVRRAQATTPNDTYYRFQWHYQLLQMELAWDLEQGSSDVVVGVADTGIVSTHPDFSGRLIAGFDFISDPGRALDGDGIDPDPEDPGDLSNFPNSSWHGTHVAGTIGARSNDGVGVAGMDWACRLMPLRVLGLNGGTSIDILEAVKFAAGLPNVSGTTPQVPRGRVDVLNMSLGGAGGSTAEEAVYAQVRQAGVLVVCAAGNDGTTEPHFPASYPSNLSVGAVRYDKTRAFYSNQATTVDVMAPGGDVTVDQNGDGYSDGVLSCSADANRAPVYVFEMGTSMASPHVAGLASLLLASRPTASANELELLILQNTEDLGDPGVDPVFRHGLIDPLAAIRTAQNSNPTTPILAADPGAVNLGSTASTAQVTLSNVGDPAQQVQVTGTTIDPPTATWLTATLVPTADPSITHDRLDLAVDRTGLADGRYTATVTITVAAGAPATVDVTMDVGASVVDDTIYVLLVETTNFATVAQGETTRLQNFAWNLAATQALPIPDASYLLVAGTDRDNDNFIGDEGELFGVWPLDDSPELLVIDPLNRVRTGLDFALAPVTQLSSVGGGTYRRLR